jgi:hypothetical protein
MCSTPMFIGRYFVGPFWQSLVMEAIGEHAPEQATRLGRFPDAASGTDPSGGLDRSLSLLKTLSTTAAADAALLGFRGASDFAGQVEELSRTVEYLQLVAAAAVDRARSPDATTTSGHESRAFADWPGLPPPLWHRNRGTRTAGPPSSWMKPGDPLRPAGRCWLSGSS